MKEPIRPAHPIVGTWRLMSFTEEDIRTNAVTYPLGEKPNAFVIYSADGYTATIFTSANRKPPSAAQATEEEAIQLYRTMVAFAGRYELEVDELTYHPEASWNEAWNGTTQIRQFEINGDRLHVKSMPVLSTLTGTNSNFSLVWARAK